jgi:lipopolysaccharide/colanic/teichoic acid biosynthesis glycosyltransferase
MTWEQSVIKYPWLDNFKPDRRFIDGKAYTIFKRIIDLGIIILSLPILTLVFLVCAITIKLNDPTGSVFFPQERTGMGGKRFMMIKFRTMIMGADEKKNDLLHLNELKWPDFKISDDPRITKWGTFLRKTSLDELPQIINVIKGEMSLVGPRPTSFSAETYSLWHTERLDVMPGITGLWQLLGRGESEFDERLRLDIAYIERQSIWFDLCILLRTLISVFRQKGS